MARRFASLVPFYEYDDSQFFVPTERPRTSSRRAVPASCGSARCCRTLAKTAGLTGEIAGGVSTCSHIRYRVPFQFSGYVRRHLKRAASRILVRCDRQRSRRQSAV